MVLDYILAFFGGGGDNKVIKIILIAVMGGGGAVKWFNSWTCMSEIRRH